MSELPWLSELLEVQRRLSRLEDGFIMLSRLMRTPDIHQHDSVFLKCFHTLTEEILGDRPLGDGRESFHGPEDEKGSA